MWAVLGQRFVAIRCTVLAVVAVAAGFAVAYVIGDDTLFWVSTILIQSLLLLASLGMIRVAGYRLVGKKARSEDGKIGTPTKEAASPFKPL
jgi:hypothetical protein